MWSVERRDTSHARVVSRLGNLIAGVVVLVANEDSMAARKAADPQLSSFAAESLGYGDLA